MKTPDDDNKLPHIPGTEVLCMTNAKTDSTYQPDDVEAFVRAGHKLGVAGREIVQVQVREGNCTILEIVHRSGKK